MNMKFVTPDLIDKRIVFASAKLENDGFVKVEKAENANFVLLGVNPDKESLKYDIPTFAGNIRADNVFDYTKNEGFALKNAYLTAEGAIALAVSQSEKSLVNARVFITGYGRIAKALQRYLEPYTRQIEICARSVDALTLAEATGAVPVAINTLSEHLEQDFIFNTVPHPLFNSQELSKIDSGTLLIDLASFPGGVDKHSARAKGIHLLEARGLPAKYSPQSAGTVVAEAVEEMLKEVFH